jgi:hydroxymethylglutaryl-CoA synthase
VFEGTIQQGWQFALKDVNLFETLESFEINFETYENCIKKNKISVCSPKNEWILDYIETDNSNLIELRYYKWWRIKYNKKKYRQFRRELLALLLHVMFY